MNKTMSLDKWINKYINNYIMQINLLCKKIYNCTKNNKMKNN